ncbi:unnamed protein product [Arctogadus glacialis]
MGDRSVYPSSIDTARSSRCEGAAAGEKGSTNTAVRYGYRITSMSRRPMGTPGATRPQLYDVLTTVERALCPSPSSRRAPAIATDAFKHGKLLENVWEPFGEVMAEAGVQLAVQRASA